jgi:acetyl-CoA carboxylase beta subunit
MPERFLASGLPLGELIYQDAFTRCHLSDSQVILIFDSKEAAGAIGQAQGQSLLRALDGIQTHSFQTLSLQLNSAGAHFGEPLEGLFHLNAIVEALWQLRNRGVVIQVDCVGWLYGGMAMILASVADEITLHEQAHMGLFGPKVHGNQAAGPLPALNFKPKQLQLNRIGS